MRVFVSYSRRDSGFVSRLVDFLRESGHEAWLDASDIRGSQEWRQSVVEAIRSADVFVLVISPRSMASADVQREVTVAAEVERRIVPVMLERAELTGGIQYELAGVQSISFVDKSFHDAAVRLLEAMEPTRASATPRESSTPSLRSVGIPRRVAGRPIALVVALVAVVGVAAGVALLTGVIGRGVPSGFSGGIFYRPNALELVHILASSNGTRVDLNVDCIPPGPDDDPDALVDACMGKPGKEGGLQMWLFTEGRCPAETIEDLGDCPGAYVVDLEPNRPDTNAIIELDEDGSFMVRGLFSASDYNRPYGGILPQGARLLPVARN